MRRTGFTLIEVLIAIAIVGIVASVSIGQYGLTVQRARWDAAQNILMAVYAGEQTYFTLNNSLYRTSLPSTTTAADMKVWREIFVDNPNQVSPVTKVVDVTYVVTPLAATLSATFVVTATNTATTKTMSLDQNRQPGGADNWPRP